MNEKFSKEAIEAEFEGHYKYLGLALQVQTATNVAKMQRTIGKAYFIQP